ncbi:MAG: lipopolysaccharide heptosyltransferase II [Candidatus Cloacimonadaceae bacterium]
MKILIIRFSHLGDIVLTQPIVQKLHEVFPEAELYYLTKEQYKEIPAFFGIPLKVLSYSELLSSFSQLRQQQFDLVFDLQNKLNSFMIKHFCLRARSFTYDKQRRLRQAIVKHATDESINSTLDLYQSALLKAAKDLQRPELAYGLNNPQLILNPDVLDKMQSRLQKPSGKKLIALFPGATHKTKMYPAESFVRAIQLSGDAYHYWLLGSKDEIAITYQINFQTADRSTDLAGKFNLAELIYGISMADALITNDSGPMHLAAALGKPHIAIFGSTHPRLGFRPLNDKAVILCKDKSCQPCSLHGLETCPRKHFACMLSLHPDELVSALKSLL